MEHIFFYIGLCFILAHEMDAIRLKEWKLFLFLGRMPEEAAYRIFTAIHIPLYMFFFWGLFGSVAGSVNSRFIMGLNGFFIIHIVLHLLFLKHPDYHFKSVVSWALILGAGAAGAVDIALNVQGLPA